MKEHQKTKKSKPIVKIRRTLDSLLVQVYDRVLKAISECTKVHPCSNKKPFLGQKILISSTSFTKFMTHLKITSMQDFQINKIKECQIKR